ncbi:DUF3592 domain-containing protein [Corynebacterium sputi]|uniref:DUF3592 domain-containing protein n=1 Tax=Corynebacterium sputi TaxID=489915 RepID=UPI000405986B|nr:DUF3592 domain-containing protein [Corynebacterium sputi]
MSTSRPRDHAGERTGVLIEAGRWLRDDWPRKIRQSIVFILGCLFISCSALVWGAWLDDRSIQADGPGNAVANVRQVEGLRTTIDFVDKGGEYRSPANGVLYPVGLEQGQRVRVEYDRSNPDLVRVEGRRWTLALIPAVSVLAVGMLIAAPVWWWSVRVSRRSSADQDESIPVSPDSEPKM